jgi:hypothetical protein
MSCRKRVGSSGNAPRGGAWWRRHRPRGIRLAPAMGAARCRGPWVRRACPAGPAKAEAIEPLDAEAGRNDRCVRAAGGVEAAHRPPPDPGGVEAALQRCRTRARRPDVLVEPQLAPGPGETGKLAEGRRRVLDAAQHCQDGDRFAVGATHGRRITDATTPLRTRGAPGRPHPPGRAGRCLSRNAIASRPSARTLVLARSSSQCARRVTLPRRRARLPAAAHGRRRSQTSTRRSAHRGRGGSQSPPFRRPCSWLGSPAALLRGHRGPQ